MKLRVLHVIPGTDTDPATIHARRNIADLVRAGLVAETFFLKSRTRPDVLLYEWFRLRKKINYFAPDIIHAQYGTVTAFFCICATRKPIVVTFRGAELNPEPDISRLREKTNHILSQLAAIRAAHVVCVSERLKQRLWWRTTPTTIIPSGVNPQAFFPQPRASARRLLGWGANESVVLFNQGRFPKSKGRVLACAAVERARAAYGRIRMEILDGRIDPASIPTYLNASDCLLSTSISEGAPTLVKEAMACNLPIVSVDVGDVAERIGLVSNCYLCRYDQDELGNAIASVLRSGKRSNGRLFISSFTNEACRERLMNVYQQVLKDLPT